MNVIRVAVDVPLPTLFDYLCDRPIGPGLRVVVPFGRRRVVGIVMEQAEHSAVSPGRLRHVHRILDDAPPLPDQFLEIVRFCSRYYHHPIGEVALAALPARLRDVRPLAAPAIRHAYRALAADQGSRALPARARRLQRAWALLRRTGVLGAHDVAGLKAEDRKALEGLVERGWAERIHPVPARAGPRAEDASLPALTDEQSAAVAEIAGAAPGFRVWLLHGVTGSGKTEVYFRLIDRALAAKRQVLMLVPEINLTPQLRARVADRFPEVPLATLHSAMAAGERASSWLAASKGDRAIVLGTRSAVFVPLPRLGLIIVDEEHDGSLKQIEGLRYHARDLAVWRGQQGDVPVVLGSATPSLESWRNARSGRFGLLRLTRRATGSPLPRVVLLPTRGLRLADGLSTSLVGALRERVQRGEQVLVFVNRRGYAPVLRCGGCDWIAGCPRCSARLVLHLGRGTLQCHHCGHSEPRPEACPECGNAGLKPLGAGTQRVEAALRAALPEASILRIDRDTTRARNAWEGMRGQIERGEADVLVGTQLMAKGHDFPSLSLVAVLGADRSLYSSDFRASEQLFAQLMQVSGRAGRGQVPGTVVVQTEFPEHPLYQALCRHDFDGYADSLLDEREQAGFPPFVHQALLRADALESERVFAFLASAAALAAPMAGEVAVFDPAPCVMARLKGHERGQLLVQSRSRAALHRFLQTWIALLREQKSGDVRWAVDVDPLDV